MSPHSLEVNTVSVAKAGASTAPPCTMRTSPPLRVAKSRPDPSGVHASPVMLPRLALET
jgi:hypothetical protein